MPGIYDVNMSVKYHACYANCRSFYEHTTPATRNTLHAKYHAWGVGLGVGGHSNKVGSSSLHVPLSERWVWGVGLGVGGVGGA